MESVLNNVDDDSTFLPLPNAQQLEDIRRMAGLAISSRHIADKLNIPVDQLLKTCGQEIAAAALASHQAVLQALYEMATSKKCPGATTFWVKNMCADLLRTPEKKETVANRSPNSKEPLTPENFKPIEFDVYCNDGEPNFDY
jgi:hypothetical protein